MILRIKKLNEQATMPTKAHPNDAGLDITATSKSFDDYGNIVYGTGLAFEIPTGYVGLLFPRSSNAKKDLVLSNSVGVIDSDYRGEVMFKFKPICSFATTYKVGDRIGQMIIIPYPKVEIQEVDELSSTERGTGGYGSSGE